MQKKKVKKLIDSKLYDKLEYLGIIHSKDDTRNYNVGNSNYSEVLVREY